MRARTLVTLAAGAIFLAAPLAAATPHGAPAPIAAEHIGGTTLSVTPQVPYESAALRISGPDGYALTRSFDAGTPITVDLLAARESAKQFQGDPSARNLAGAAVHGSSTFPDGLYRYEVVFTGTAGDPRVHTGLFFVEGGSAVPRHAKQAELSEIRTQLENVDSAGEVAAQEGLQSLASFPNNVNITDDNNDGEVFLGLFSDLPNPNSWGVVNQSGLFLITSSDYGLGLAIDQNQSVGIGTTAPTANLNIVDGVPVVQIETSDAAHQWQLLINPGTEEFRIRDRTDFTTVARFNKNSPDSALSTDAVGVGIGIPIGNATNAPLHVLASSFNSNNTMQVERQDGVTPNIRFKTSGGPVTQSWLFQNNANSGVFAIRDETGGNSVLRLRPGAPENGLTINANGSFTTSTGATLTAGGVWQNASSRALKQEINDLPVEAALAALTELRAVTFAYKKTPGESHVGFIAEDVPELVATASRKTLSTMEIVGVLTRVVQEQQNVIAAMKHANAEQAKRLAALEASMTK